MQIYNHKGANTVTGPTSIRNNKKKGCGREDQKKKKKKSRGTLKKKS